MKKWRLQNKQERRYKQGHPWVYSNELQGSPKGVEPGEVVELGDSGGQFLAYGIANPNSLIAFRTLSRTQEDGAHFEGECINADFFYRRFIEARKFRAGWFTDEQSYRLVYGEVDGCPGLVIDRYVGRDAKGTSTVAYVVQPHSAGMDKNLMTIREALSRLSREAKEPAHAVMVARRDAGSREREGIEKVVTAVMDLHTSKEHTSVEDWRNFAFSVPGSQNTNLEIYADLIQGQKTGFFLDQLQNIQLVENLLLQRFRVDRSGLKILDLCCYVGQWSVHLSQAAILRDSLPLHVTLVDASDTALKFAEKNMQHLIARYAREQKALESKISVERLKADVLEPMPSLKDQFYDVVIADPPALIKSRKHIPQGQHAYVNLMTTAIGKVTPGGLIVTCSCSQLLSNEDFKQVLEKATRRSARHVRWIAQGSPSIDHFNLMSFHEGHYLKCFVGQVT